MTPLASAMAVLTGVCRLYRLPLALMNGTAALGGYLLFPAPEEALTGGAVFLGVSLLAAAGSALNQLLERDLDAVMRRTKNRPLPSGELSPVVAALLGLASLLAGGILLAQFGGPVPVTLGLATLLWYLAVYTPLKRVTCFALLLGALCGCAAPMIGWSVAGGALADFRVVLLAGILYLWQVPHFWMLQRRHAEDYRVAGFPLFVPADGGRGLAPFQLIWMTAMIAGALMLPAFGLLGDNALPWSVAFSIPLLLGIARRWEPALFAGLNLFPVLVTLALYAGR